MPVSSVEVRTNMPGEVGRRAEAWGVVERVETKQGLALAEQESFYTLYRDHTAYLAVDRDSASVIGVAVVKGMGHISLLAVLPDCQRKGVGEQLVEEVVDNHLVVSLYVRVDNQRARDFYAMQGFEETKRIPEMYHDDEDGLFLEHEDNIPVLGDIITVQRRL